MSKELSTRVNNPLPPPYQGGEPAHQLPFSLRRGPGGGASRELWQRLYEAISHRVERLQAYKVTRVGVEHPFRDSVVTNLVKLVDVLPKLNVTGDPELERLAAQVRASQIADPQELRKSELVRSETGKAATAICDRMAEGGFEMIRYADDFVILCRSEAEARAALAEVQASTASAGLRLHPTKTRILDATQMGGFDFLSYYLTHGARALPLTYFPASTLSIYCVLPAAVSFSTWISERWVRASRASASGGCSSR